MDNILIALFVLYVIFVIAIITTIIVVYVRNRQADNTETVISGAIAPTETYTSPVFDISVYEYSVLQISSDQSTEDTIDIQVSSDNKNWINSGVTLSPIATGSGSGYFSSDPLYVNYFRIKFTNNGASNITLKIYVTKKNY